MTGPGPTPAGGESGASKTATDGRAVKFSSVHAFGLASFALALPLFLTLSASPEFFFAHGFTPREMIQFAIALGVALPVVVGALIGVVNAIPARRMAAAGWFVAGVLAAIAFLPTMNRVSLLPGAIGLTLSMMLGALGVRGYLRFRAVRDFCTLLALAALLYPVWFLWRLDVFTAATPVASEATDAADEWTRPPVVWVVFDEFSVEALLDDSGELDAARFPNFAALASTSLWYRDTTTVAEMTTEAVPAILTGRYPAAGTKRAPVYFSHGENAFTVLHAAGYGVYAREVLTRLCPPRINRVTPAAPSVWAEFAGDIEVVAGHVFLGRLLGAWLPDMERQVSHFRRSGADVPLDGMQAATFLEAASFRARIFGEFVDQISGNDGEFHYVHVNLPHYEYQFLGSGRQYLSGMELADSTSFLGAGGAFNHGEANRARTRLMYPIALARQRYLLQAQFVDHLLGGVIAKLRALDAFDRCVLVVTADHGVSFRPGMSDRIAVGPGADRVSDDDHARDIVKVPLFIKPAGMTEGRRVGLPAETIDILPTVLEAVGISPRHYDGRSLFDEAPRDGGHRLYSELNLGLVEHATAADAPGYLAARSAMNMRAENFRPVTAWDAAFLGRAVESLGARDSALRGVGATISRGAAYATVDIESWYLPAYLITELSIAGDAELPVAVVVALNGEVVAVAVPFEDDRGRTWAGAMLPEAGFVDGANRIELYGIVETGAGRVVAPIAGGTAP